MSDLVAGGVGGPEGPPERPRADQMAGELVTETLDYDMVGRPRSTSRRSGRGGRVRR